MSEKQPPRHERAKKLDHKIRSGMTIEQYQWYKDYLRDHGYGPGLKPESSFNNAALMLAIGRQPVNIAALDIFGYQASMQTTKGDPDASEKGQD